MLGGTQGQISFSDDGGVTWTAALVGQYFVDSFARTTDIAHPYGGTIYAGALEFGRDEDPRATVLGSEDGGASWTVRHRFVAGELGLSAPYGVAVVVGPDGLLYGGLRQVVGGPQPDVGTVVRSADGGLTWEEVATGYSGWAVNNLAVGRDGRLYMVTDGGAWRTVDPIAVAVEVSPEASERVGVSVRPNPASGRVAVVLNVVEAGTARVVVVDALGREVAVVLAGAVAAGETALSVETGAWPAGVYVVRASVGNQSASARLVVAR